MLNIICFVAIVIGGVLMTITAVRYNRLLRATGKHFWEHSRYARIVKTVTRIVPYAFIACYAVGALDMLLRDVEPVYYVVGFAFSAGSGFIFLLVQNLALIADKLQSQNSALEDALHKIAKNNETLQTEVDRRVEKIVWQDQILHTVNETASILLASEVETFGEAVVRCMEMLADSTEADRISIWQNEAQDGMHACRRIHTFSKSLSAAEMLPSFVYAQSAPGWEIPLAAGQAVNGTVRNMQGPEHALLARQGVLSVLLIPVFLRDSFWGFIAFDDCRQERYFPEEAINTLHSASLLLANAILRNDLTENLIQAREDALQGARAKGDFLSTMSHEIRTPINAITGMATIARGTEDIARIHRCLDSIDAASRQLLGLINDILDMSKIEVLKMTLAHEPFDLTATVLGVQSIIQVRVDEKAQHLQLDLSPDLPRVLIGDDMRLSQVWINLLSNAVKFTPDGGHIRFSLRPDGTEGGKQVLIAEVQDDGIGISDEQQARLFRSFEQAEHGTARRFGGSGLGLAISRGIATLMGGDIAVQSALGGGSLFTVRMLLDVGTPDMLRPAKSRLPAKAYSFAGKTALLAEDIEINREIVLALLEDTQIAIDCVENGQEAVEKFQGTPDRYDIIFMDIQMPIMDGYTAAEQIRLLPTPRAKAVPIIAMTANAFSEDVARALASGMNDHIAKPIDADVLLRTIAAHLA